MTDTTRRKLFNSFVQFINFLLFIPHSIIYGIRAPKRQCGEYDITIAACKTRYTLTYNVSCENDNHRERITKAKRERVI